MCTSLLLRDLVEVLEDTIAFHDDTARSSMGDPRVRHEEMVVCYTAMQNEVTAWEDRRKRECSGLGGAAASESASDDFPALTHRIDRMYHMQCTDHSTPRAGGPRTVRAMDCPRPGSMRERGSEQVEPIALPDLTSQVAAAKMKPTAQAGCQARMAAHRDEHAQRVVIDALGHVSPCQKLLSAGSTVEGD